MTDNYTYARPYAEAAFKTADADKTVADWKNDLETLSYVTDRQDIKALLSNPKVSQSKSIEFLKQHPKYLYLHWKHIALFYRSTWLSIQ